MNNYQRLFRLSAIGCALFSAACGGEAASADGQIASTEQALTKTEGSTYDQNCKWMTYHDKEIWGCRYKLPVGPKGTPAPWGICGLTNVEGNGDAKSVVRIFTGADGYYYLLVGVGDPSPSNYI